MEESGRASRLTLEDRQTIAEIVDKVQRESEARRVCSLCAGAPAIERHNRHHVFIDKLEKLFDRLDNMKWKTMSGVIITVIGALILAVLGIFWKLTVN